MTTVQALHGCLVRLLAGELSLAEFEDWFAQESWNMHLDSEESAQQLASQIGLALAEYSNGHMDREELYKELWQLAENCFLRVSFGDAHAPLAYKTATESQTAPIPVDLVPLFGAQP